MTRHHPLSLVVFLPTARQAGFAADVLSEVPGLEPIHEIHSRLSQARRTKVANDFARAKTGVLLSSDVTARGMDFPGYCSTFISFFLDILLTISLPYRHSSCATRASSQSRSIYPPSRSHSSRRSNGKRDLSPLARREILFRRLEIRDRRSSHSSSLSQFHTTWTDITNHTTSPYRTPTHLDCFTG